VNHSIIFYISFILLFMDNANYENCPFFFFFFRDWIARSLLLIKFWIQPEHGYAFGSGNWIVCCSSLCSNVKLFVFFSFFS
jgi:hypothetical protein